MCTLVVRHRLEADDPVLVAANRDESFQRPSEPPSIVEEGPFRVLAPRDSRAGGTWLGLNEEGVFAGLTNRFGGPANPDRRSRGEIVFHALEVPAAAEGAAAVAELEATDYNAFHLLVVDSTGMFAVVGDGGRSTVTPVETELAVVTERSFGAADNPRKRRLRRRLQTDLDTDGLDLEMLGGYLTDCSGGIDAVCVNLEETDYGTRSSTLIRFGGGDVEFRHAEGAPCDVEYEDLSDLARDVLGDSGRDRP